MPVNSTTRSTIVQFEEQFFLVCWTSTQKEGGHRCWTGMEDTHTVLFVVITVALTFATVGVCHAACLWLQPRCVRRQRPPEDGASGLGSILSTHQAAAGLCWSSVDQIHAGICWNLLPADLQRAVLKFAFNGRL